MKGYSEGTCTNTRDSSNSPVVVDNFSNYNRLKFRTFLRKMIWEFAFACVAAPCGAKNEGKGLKKTTLKHNKVWLLAESSGCEAELAGSAEPQSVQSSFRFSFCSQVEVESLSVSSAATVLMVNLECESRDKEMKWRRMESLEKSISPVVNTLTRFTYDEILSATRNFSKGNYY